MIPLALPNPIGPVYQFTETILQEAMAMASQSTRRRIIVPIHRSPEDTVQRMVNVMLRGTYVRPHIHRGPNACELIYPIAGVILFVAFSESGELVNRVEMRAGLQCPVVDIIPGVWHTFFPVSEYAAVLEIKAGPFDSKADKEFAAWGPLENTPEAVEFVHKITNNHI